MAVCMMCHKKIPDGTRYCEECKIIMKQKADESYLDSLLNSVSKNNSANTGLQQVQKKKKEITEKTVEVHQSVETTDDMLNDLLADMEEVGFGDGTDEQPEPDFEIDDLADIFSEAENNAIKDDLFEEIPDETEPAEQPVFSDTSAAHEDEYPDISVEIPADANPDKTEENNLDLNNESNNDSAKDNIENNGSDIFDDSMLGPADLAILNGENGSGNVVNIDWSTSGENSDFEVDAELDSLFEEVTEPIHSEIKNDDEVEDLNSILGLDSDNDEELDKIMNEMSSGSFDGNSDSDDSGSSEDNSSDDIDDKKSKPKKSLWKRLFGNILDKTPKQIEEEEKLEELKEQEKKEKAEIEKAKAAEKKKKAQADKAKAKAEAEIAKKAKEAKKAEQKAAEKEKARKKKEEALALAEFEVEHGRINRAGATILFVIFAILTIIIIIGTNIYSYNLSIENAREDFEIKKYNDAYYEVYGLNIQAEDIELYDRIMTVMYVNTQLNSYEYYMTSNSREKALDSLLKGLERYNKYLKLAITLDIKEDLNYVRDQILDKLLTEFDITEDQAYNMIVIDDNIDYSDYIYELIGSYEEQINKIDITKEITK